MTHEEAKRVMNGLITVSHSLRQVCNDLDFIAQNQVPPVVKLLNACNDTVLNASTVVQTDALAVVELTAMCETLQDTVNMMSDFIADKNLTDEYIKHTEKYD